MAKDKKLTEFEKVMQGLSDPKKTNPAHKERLARDAKQAKAVKDAAKKAEKQRKGRHTAGGSDVIDTGMFR
jgi:hypothetical protein